VLNQKCTNFRKGHYGRGEQDLPGILGARPQKGPFGGILGALSIPHGWVLFLPRRARAAVLPHFHKFTAATCLVRLNVR
jgi:hypothetical protein